DSTGANRSKGVDDPQAGAITPASASAARKSGGELLRTEGNDLLTILHSPVVAEHEEAAIAPTDPEAVEILIVELARIDLGLVRIRNEIRRRVVRAEHPDDFGRGLGNRQSEPNGRDRIIRDELISRNLDAAVALRK